MFKKLIIAALTISLAAHPLHCSNTELKNEALEQQESESEEQAKIEAKKKRRKKIIIAIAITSALAAIGGTLAMANFMPGYCPTIVRKYVPNGFINETAQKAYQIIDIDNSINNKIVACSKVLQTATMKRFDHLSKEEQQSAIDLIKKECNKFLCMSIKEKLTLFKDNLDKVEADLEDSQHVLQGFEEDAKTYAKNNAFLMGQPIADTKKHITYLTTLKSCLKKACPEVDSLKKKYDNLQIKNQT